jgi:Domain of unknown function (DUF1707)
VFDGSAPVVMGPEGRTFAADRQGLRLRASHADRERVIEVLKVAFVQGRLTRDELDTRIGEVFASKTYADLAAVTADLPPGPAADARPPRQVNVEAAVSLTVAAIAIPALLLSGGYLTANAGLVKVAVLLVLLDLLALLAAGAQIIDNRYRRRTAQHGPGPARPPAHSP